MSTKGVASHDDILAAIDARIAELQEARAVIVRVFGPAGGTSSPAPARTPKATAPPEVRQARPLVTGDAPRDL